MTFLQQAVLLRARRLFTGLGIGDFLPSERKTAEAAALGRSVVRGLFQSLADGGFIARVGNRWILKRKLPKADKASTAAAPLTKRQLVKDHLIAGLSGGGWQAGQRISELALSRELGVSTVTVREALLELQPLGVISKRERQQWEIVAFKRQRIEQLREFREMVEVFALRKLLCVDLPPARHMAFVENRDRTRHVLSLARPHPQSMLDVDLEFHRLLLDAADNPLLKERASFIYIIIEFQLMNPRFRVERGSLGLRQHLKILDAILAGNSVEAERHLLQHLQSAEETLRQVAGGIE